MPPYVIYAKIIHKNYVGMWTVTAIEMYVCSISMVTACNMSGQTTNSRFKVDLEGHAQLGTWKRIHSSHLNL